MMNAVASKIGIVHGRLTATAIDPRDVTAATGGSFFRRITAGGPVWPMTLLSDPELTRRAAICDICESCGRLPCGRKGSCLKSEPPDSFGRLIVNIRTRNCPEKKF